MRVAGADVDVFNGQFSRRVVVLVFLFANKNNKEARLEFPCFRKCNKHGANHS